MPRWSRKLNRRSYKIFRSITKTKFYAFLGYVFVVFGGVGGFVAFFMFYPEKWDQILAGPQEDFLPVVIECAVVLACNVAVWAGFFFFWRFDRNANAGRRSRWIFASKLYWVFVVILVPVFVLTGVFMPFLRNAQSERRFMQYALEDDFTKREIADFVKRIAKEESYEFYFRFLDETIDNIIDEVYFLLDQNRSQELFLEVIERDKKEVKLTAKVFASMIVPEEYRKKPQMYRELNDMMAKFLYEEFRLTVLGTFYKATYDSTFSFNWDRSTELSAIKLRQVLNMR